MIELGRYNRLVVSRIETDGYYFERDKEWGEILLPLKKALKPLSIGEALDVFVYFDSEDVVIATTDEPYATVGEFCYLQVASVESFGVFLNWGLEKDLFVPFREQVCEMKEGEFYVVYLYVDSSNRISASTRLTKFIQNDAPPFKEGDAVDILICQTTDLGIKAIVNGSHYGLLFNNELIQNIELGQKLKAYIRKIRSDHKIDLSLSPKNIDGRDELAGRILDKLSQAGGVLEVNAKTPSATIHAMFGVSRNKFKMALGNLYKRRLISIDEKGISLLSNSDD